MVQIFHRTKSGGIIGIPPDFVLWKTRPTLGLCLRAPPENNFRCWNHQQNPEEPLLAKRGTEQRTGRKLVH